MFKLKYVLNVQIEEKGLLIVFVFHIIYIYTSTAIKQLFQVIDLPKRKKINNIDDTYAKL